MTRIEHKITPHFWLEKAEEAANFYVSIFPDSRIVSTQRIALENPVVVIVFELNGQQFTAFNGNPGVIPTEAVSFMVGCETQEEIDHFWKHFNNGGKELQCGWIKDRFGIVWQVNYAGLPALMADPSRAPRVMQEMMTMQKIEIARLEKA